jgi:hypothetical protein
MLVTLPITVADLNRQVLDPVFTQLLPSWLDSPQARVMLLSISPQEAGDKGIVTSRQQIGGPAHGLWQNELGGMVTGVLTNPATMAMAIQVCGLLGVDPTPAAVYTALLTNDYLACVFARLGLWADPHALPALGDSDDAWLCYCANWRPGKPRPSDWPPNYQAAITVISP